ncbi:MAG: response regulator transcription factor [Akkermansiaceae bacterium]|nr:response regulator transcription factor [Akkermansiaceae bacterium]
MTPPPIRVLLVDDHFIIRMGLAGALARESDIQVVGEAATGSEALALFDRLLPDITLMDGMLPDMHGVEVVSRIIARHPSARVIMVSINETPEDIHQAMEAGASGYLSKSCGKQITVNAIRSVAAGGVHLPPEIKSKLSERASYASLGSREIEVLRRIARGRANKEIAAELNLSELTVKAHISHILSKLGAPDRTRAVTLALERGILRL